MPFDIHRGTNVSHWLSQSEARGEARRRYFTRGDAQRLADLGLDHLRIPIDEEQMWDESGRRDREAFDLLDGCLQWCRELRLRVIVDLHILRSHHFNDAEEPRLFADPAEPERFADLWRDLSAHLRRRPNDEVAYELLNEAVARDGDDWNLVARVAYDAIRQEEPERVIVLGSNRWNSPLVFEALDIPDGDANLVLTFHYYLPMLITHYRAQWARTGAYEGPVHYPGQPIAPSDWDALPAEMKHMLAEHNVFYNASVMERDLAQPMAVRKRTGLTIYCGEFGCINQCPDAVRAAWYRDFRSVLDAHGIAWATWDYKGLFGLFDARGKPTVVVEAMLK